MPHSVAIVIFPGFQLLDATGPIAVMEMAQRQRPGMYDVGLLAPGGGEVPSSSGVCLSARPLDDTRYDTIIVSGGLTTRPSDDFPVEVVEWLKRAQPGRLASVCSGAHVLAAAGLLDGRHATTHWNRTDDFARRFPKVKLKPDRIFVRDENVWTSAGITAGIDLTLALIEEDLGPDIARRAAQQLVVHHRRPGGQSQFSHLIEVGGGSGRFTGLMDWVRANLAEPLTVEQLAERAAMTPRTFARVFVAEMGATPAKVVQRLRLEMARSEVEGGTRPLEVVAQAVGFGDQERMRRAFLRAFGQPPQALRRAARVDRRRVAIGRPPEAAQSLTLGLAQAQG